MTRRNQPERNLQRARNKYKAKKVKTEDGTFDSQAEYRRWCELKLLEKAGKIDNLRRQVKYPLKVNDETVCSYVADFVYRELDAESNVGIVLSRPVVEDYKGYKTAEYRLKAKLFRAVYGLSILETKVAA